MLLNKLQITSLTDGTTGGTTDIQKTVLLNSLVIICNTLCYKFWYARHEHFLTGGSPE